MPENHFRPGLARTLLLILFFNANSLFADEWQFQVNYSKEIQTTPFTGRVYLFFTQRKTQPRFGPDWFHPELILSQDVQSLKPGESVTFSSSHPKDCLSFPSPINELDFSNHRVQAVFRFNPYSMKWGTAPGNGYSDALQLGQQGGSFQITANHLVKESSFNESRWSELFRHQSKMLTEFHGRDIFLQGAVMLPAGYYNHPGKKYPVIFMIPGFGGDHTWGATQTPPNDQEHEFIRVLLDPSCQYGHHVFADSETNGPVGKAFIEEFIPALEKKYPLIADSRARFLTGHSSGGWSSLWLQTTYPDQFGGTWSTAPDPVDFRDFQQINLYKKGENMFFDEEGNPRPIARRGLRPILWYKSFSDMEHVLGHGGQLDSFEAVFSPKGKDGKPTKLWNRQTGLINHEVAEHWKNYDIRLKLTENSKRLKTKLKGKIHVYMGDQDTFYLEGSTRLLKEVLQEAGYDASITMVPQKDHFTLLSSQLRTEILKEMNQQFNTNYIQATR